MLETMNSVEKNVRNKIVKDEDYLIVRLVTYFITLTFVKCVSDLFVGYQCLLHGSFCVAPAYFDVWPELNKTVFWGGFCGVPG